jgi:TRAP-type mannitol/chloroaromatic compound transport system permease small subunit
MKIRHWLDYIDRLNKVIGGVARYLILGSLIVILLEVLMRYVFSASQTWSSEMSLFLFGAFFTIGGGFTLFMEGHVRMDVFYIKLSKKGRAIMDIATFVFFLAFVGVLIWKGWDIAIRAFQLTERSESAWRPLLWPTKILIPIGAFLLLLQGLANLGRNILTLFEREGAGEPGAGITPVAGKETVNER